MNLLRSFLVMTITTLSLHAITGDDITYSFASCSDVNLSNPIKVLDVNSTQTCHYMGGLVDGNAADNIDIYLFKNTEDLPLTYRFIDVIDNKTLQYNVSGYNASVCPPALTTTTDGDIADYNISNPQEYTAVYVTTGNNQPSEYKLAFGLTGACLGDGSPGSTESMSYGDVIDTPIITSSDSIAYNSSIDTSSSGIKYIKTKQAGETVPLTAVYYNDFNQSADYQVSNPNSQVWFMMPLLNDLSITNGCPAPYSNDLEQLIDASTGAQAVMVLKDLGANDYSVTKNVIMPAHASRNAKIEFIVVDTSKLGVDAQNCVEVSSTTGNLQGLGQCVNSRVQYVDAYGEPAAERCVDNEDTGQPCLSDRHGEGTGLFAGPLGCLMCTFYAGTSCSQDNFAIRPEQFDINSTEPHYPDLLRAGQDYSLSIKAYDFGTTTPTYLYNQTDSNLTITQTKWLNTPRSEDITGLLAGNTSWTSDFNIIDGISANAAFDYDDIGYITLRVEDREWAAVDSDDTNQNCDPDGAYICGENNMTFIPHHFGIVDLNVTSNNGNPGTFTYFSNIDPADSSTFDMGAKIQVTVIAQNKSNGTTANFREGDSYYENQVSLSSFVTNPNLGNANTTDYLSPALLGFGTGTDAAGTKTIAWDEDNLSKVLRFNFPRAVNVPLNPVQINSLDVNVTAESVYAQTAVAGYESSADINGTDNGLGDTNTTFYYGRSHAPRTRIAGPDRNATFYYEVYCFGTDVTGNSCDPTLRDSITGGLLSVDDIRWFQNTNHINTDGNISATSQKNTLLNLNLRTPVNGFPTPQLSTVHYTYSGDKGYPYKTTMNVNSSDWLIFHKFDAAAMVNNFELEFNSAAGWSETTQAGENVDSGASLNTNRRIQW